MTDEEIMAEIRGLPERRMRVVIDTNVVVSAIFRDRKPEEVIMFVRRQPQLEWVASAEILAEYTDVIQRKKFNLPHTIIARWIEIFSEVIRVVGVQHYDFPTTKKMPDSSLAALPPMPTF